MSKTESSLQLNYSRKELVYLTKTYLKMGFFEEATFFSTQFIEKNPKLTSKERLIFISSFKKTITKKRSSWRILQKRRLQLESNSEIRQKENDKLNELEGISEVQLVVEEEIKEIVNLMINLIDEYLIKDVEDYENAAFYFKVKADYFRYICEISIDNNRIDAIKETEENYKQAYIISEKELEITNDTRLGIILNYSVFLWEIKDSKEEAAVIAQNGFNSVYELLQDMEENQMKESIILVQLIRENLLSWSKQIEEGVFGEEENEGNDEFDDNKKIEEEDDIIVDNE